NLLHPLISHAHTHIYTLSLHDALPIFSKVAPATTNNTIAIASATRETTSLISFLFSQFFYTFLQIVFKYFNDFRFCNRLAIPVADRKSTRLNSSHVSISYSVFCLKKKK